MIYLPRFASQMVNLVRKSITGSYSMTCVNLKSVSEGKWQVEATDGKLGGILRGTSSPSSTDEESVKKIAQPEPEVTETVLPIQGFKDAFSILPKDNPTGARHVGALLTKYETIFSSGDTVIRQVADGGRFPDLEGAFPKDAPLASVRLDPDLLTKLLKVARAVQDSGEQFGVEITLYAKGKPVVVRANGAEGVTFEGLLMPLT